MVFLSEIVIPHQGNAVVKNQAESSLTSRIVVNGIQESQTPLSQKGFSWFLYFSTIPQE